jgi:hypothetical protein
MKTKNKKIMKAAVAIFGIFIIFATVVSLLAWLGIVLVSKYTTKSEITCEDGKQLVDGACVCTGGKQFVNGVCACTGGKQFVNGQCACTGGKQFVNGKCACTGGKQFENGQCVCTDGKQFLVGRCVCADGKQFVNGVCACTGDKRLLNGKCVCEEGKRLILGLGVCVCEEGRQLVDGKCVCNEDRQLVGGKCVCKNSEHLLNGQCTILLNKTSITAYHLDGMYIKKFMDKGWAHDRWKVSGNFSGVYGGGGLKLYSSKGGELDEVKWYTVNTNTTRGDQLLDNLAVFKDNGNYYLPTDYKRIIADYIDLYKIEVSV